MPWWMWIPVVVIAIVTTWVAAENQEDYGFHEKFDLGRAIIVAGLIGGLIYMVNLSAHDQGFKDGFLHAELTLPADDCDQ